MGRAPLLLCWLCTVWNVLLVKSMEVTISVPAGKKKCFGEQVAKQELLVLEFQALNQMKISVSVMSPHATIFSEHDREKVKTAFTTTHAGPHWMCVQNKETERVEVHMSILIGPQAKDYSKLAKKEHLDESKVVLKRVEESLHEYHDNIVYIRSREERMKKTSDSTASRVIFSCLFDVALMIVVGGMQMFYFKRYFKAKKII